MVTVGAVLFDLDDTLFPQAAWLRGAWLATADAGADLGLDRAALLEALLAVASEGSAKGRIIDRALEHIGASQAPTAPLVEAFRSWRPPLLEPYAGVREGLREVRARWPVALVTDGDPTVQHGKTCALGLADEFDVVVLSDVLGRRFRKPHPAPFERAAAALAVETTACVFIGDHPLKDMVGAHRVGMRGIRVRTGEYADVPNDVEAWSEHSTIAEAISTLLDACDERAVAERESR